MNILIFAFVGYTFVFALLWHNRSSKEDNTVSARENLPPRPDDALAGNRASSGERPAQSDVGSSGVIEKGAPPTA